MTVSTNIVPTRTVAIYPYTRGFGYAVMESALDLTEMRLISPKQFNNSKLLHLMRKVLLIHGPATLVLEDCNSKYCRKGAQSKQLIRTIAAWAKKKGVHVKFYSREQIRDVFERWGAKSKYEIAEVLARNIESLKPIMFEKPKYPAREPNIEAVFSAVSMGVTHYFLND